MYELACQCIYISYKMQKLLESYKTLTQLITQIRFLAAICDTANDDSLGLNKIKVQNFFIPLPLGRSINDVTINYGLIIACSILDEYNKEVTVGKLPTDLKERLGRLKQMTKPIIHKLKRWPDLQKYRNNILAHNLKIKDGVSFFSDQFSLHTYRVPNTYLEFKLLVELLSILVRCVGDQFPEILSQIDMTERMDERLKLPNQPINFQEEIKEVIDAITPFMLNYPY